jgi:hypothetical protein
MAAFCAKTFEYLLRDNLALCDNTKFILQVESQQVMACCCRSLGFWRRVDLQVDADVSEKRAGLIIITHNHTLKLMIFTKYYDARLIL